MGSALDPRSPSLSPAVTPRMSSRKSEPFVVTPISSPVLAPTRPSSFVVSPLPSPRRSRSRSRSFRSPSMSPISPAISPDSRVSQWNQWFPGHHHGRDRYWFHNNRNHWIPHHREYLYHIDSFPDREREYYKSKYRTEMESLGLWDVAVAAFGGLLIGSLIR
jgi:hypothetical protein